MERFKLSNDPKFEEKVRDIVGLYLNPPEFIIKLKPDVDYKRAAEIAHEVVIDAYRKYQSRIESQHKRFEKWMDASVTEPPDIKTHLQSSDTGPQYTVLFRLRSPTKPAPMKP